MTSYLRVRVFIGSGSGLSVFFHPTHTVLLAGLGIHPVRVGFGFLYIFSPYEQESAFKHFKIY